MGRRDDTAGEAANPEDDGGMKIGVDRNSLPTDWDKGRPWAGRTEQDVGTEWLRREVVVRRWSDGERAARGEGNVIPGAEVEADPA